MDAVIVGTLLSLFRLGARLVSFSFRSGGSILRLPLTTLPTVLPILPFVPVAGFAGLSAAVGFTRPASEAAVESKAVDLLVDEPVLVLECCPKSRLLLLGCDEAAAGSTAGCWPETVRL